VGKDNDNHKEIIESAYKQAVGYYVEEDKAHKVKSVRKIGDQVHPIEKVEVVKVRKYVPPSCTMNIFMQRGGPMRASAPTSGDTVIRVIFEGDLEELSK